MNCVDILHIVASFLGSIKDIISLHCVNKQSYDCRYNVILDGRKKIKPFIYEQYNIIGILHHFSDYSNIDQLLTDKLIVLRNYEYTKYDTDILNGLHNCVNLRTLHMVSNKYTDDIFNNLYNLTSLDIGNRTNVDFHGSCLTHLTALTFLDLGPTFVESKYINNLTELRYLDINTHIYNNDLSLLTNLKRLHLNSVNTITNSNINTLINLTYLVCRFSAFTSIDHLKKLETLYLGVDFTLKNINIDTLKILSLKHSAIEYIKCPNLIELNTSYNMTDKSLKVHTSLTHLILSDNMLISDNSIKYLTKLLFLHCGNNRNITIDGLSTLTNLTHLHIGSSGITISEIKTLSTLLPKLRHVEYE